MKYNILDKSYSTEYYTPAIKILNKHSIEYYKYLSGTRESCEDSVCPCINSKGHKYKQCKEQCFKDNYDLITKCCLRSCDNIKDMGLNECLNTCLNPISYLGPDPNLPINK